VLQDIGVGPSLLVAFLAGCGNVLLTNPIWVVATRMQVILIICNIVTSIFIRALPSGVCMALLMIYCSRAAVVGWIGI
jgi:hypothetical protein